MGAAAPAALAEAAPGTSARLESIVEKQPARMDDLPSDPVREPVLNALAAGGHQMLVSMLEGGEWQVEGNELVIKVAASATVIDMTLGADARRLAIATASGVAGRALKLKVIPGNATVNAVPSRPSTNGGGRSRAEQDPIVRRMQEKFGAEIRTIIDYKERR
jgi:DNA polymerase-3 subunit gamma/tau